MAYLFYQRGYLTELRVSGIRKKFKENRLRGRQKNALLLRPFKSHLFVFFFARGDRVGHKDRRVSQLLQIDACLQHTNMRFRAANQDDPFIVLLKFRQYRFIFCAAEGSFIKIFLFFFF